MPFLIELAVILTAHLRVFLMVAVGNLVKGRCCG